MDAAPNLSEIAAFVAVVQRGSFSDAARVLGVAKSSVSRRISALEHKLGARLLQRTSRRLTLTEVGTAYHTRVSSAMGTLQQAAAIVHDLHEEPRGHLRVTAPADLGKALARMLVSFCKSHPAVSVEVIPTQRALDVVGEGFDLAIRAGDLADSSLVGRYIGDSFPIVAASPAYLETHDTPTHPSDLTDHPFVLFRGVQTRPGYAESILRGPGGEQVISMHGTIGSDDFGFVRDAVVEGAGLAILPAMCALEELSSGALVRVLPKWRGKPGPVHVVYPSRELVPAKTRALRDHIVDWMSNTMPRCIALVLEEETKSAG